MIIIIVCISLLLILLFLDFFPVVYCCKFHIEWSHLHFIKVVLQVMFKSLITKEFLNIRFNPIMLLIYSAFCYEIKKQAKFKQKEIYIAEIIASKNEFILNLRHILRQWQYFFIYKILQLKLIQISSIAWHCCSPFQFHQNFRNHCYLSSFLRSFTQQIRHPLLCNIFMNCKTFC